MSEYKAMDMVTSEQRGDRTYYVVDPSVMYPATIARMKAVKDSGEAAMELINPNGPMQRSFQTWKKVLRRYAHEELDLALVPYQEVDDVEQRAVRAEVLNYARRWFKQALRAAGAKTHGPNNLLYLHVVNENAPLESAYKEQ